MVHGQWPSRGGVRSSKVNKTVTLSFVWGRQQRMILAQ
jgi:hypothetical protein